MTNIQKVAASTEVLPLTAQAGAKPQTGSLYSRCVNRVCGKHISVPSPMAPAKPPTKPIAPSEPGWFSQRNTKRLFGAMLLGSLAAYCYSRQEQSQQEQGQPDILPNPFDVYNKTELKFSTWNWQRGRCGGRLIYEMGKDGRFLLCKTTKSEEAFLPPISYNTKFYKEDFPELENCPSIDREDMYLKNICQELVTKQADEDWAYKILRPAEKTCTEVIKAFDALSEKFQSDERKPCNIWQKDNSLFQCVNIARAKLDPLCKEDREKLLGIPKPVVLEPVVTVTSVPITTRISSQLAAVQNAVTSFFEGPDLPDLTEDLAQNLFATWRRARILCSKFGGVFEGKPGEVYTCVGNLKNGEKPDTTASSASSYPSKISSKIRFYEKNFEGLEKCPAIGPEQAYLVGTCKELATRSATEDWAKRVLKLTETSCADIKKAFKKIVLQVHPDKLKSEDINCQNKESLFHCVNVARDTLNEICEATSSEARSSERVSAKYTEEDCDQLGNPWRNVCINYNTYLRSSKGSFNFQIKEFWKHLPAVGFEVDYDGEFRLEFTNSQRLGIYSGFMSVSEKDMKDKLFLPAAFRDNDLAALPYKPEANEIRDLTS